MAFEIVVVGASTGGLNALSVLLSSLPSEFPLPLAIVQHRGKDSELGLAGFLSQHSSLPVSEPEDKEEIVSGRAYLAPRDYHLMIENRSFALSVDSPVAFARPSVDVLFESAVDEYQENVIGVILTGGNQDGARGLERVKTQGGVTIVEDPRSAACPDMPRAAIDRMEIDWILPLPEIGPRLQKLAKHNGEA